MLVWNRSTAGKLIAAVAAIVVVAITIVAVRWNSSTPATTTAAMKGRTVAPQASPVTGRKFKILHIMSYHTPWEWTEGQLAGFKDALRDLDVEYKVYEMDTNRKSSKEWLTQATQEARKLIDEWKPDLVFTSDDTAPQYVVVHYINQDIPFVFSGVNADPKDYGFVGSKNVTGVVEHEHFVQSIRLLKQLVPTVHKIAIISDKAPRWKPVLERMKKAQQELGDVEIARCDFADTFEEFKQIVKGYEGVVDAWTALGYFELKDAEGKNMQYQDVSRWTTENSNLPDFTFWLDRVHYGNLCTVSVSAFAQGQDAGKIARGILVEGKSPSSFPMLPTIKGEPIINLARARKLGLTPSSDVLLTAKVFTKYMWEE
jgi:ABC-type uncharacterized transport system substrate-binding protein